ncbi:hypothetical protein K439DRAFT_1619721 [Ramaria rubella]|nr:hypothetical protein K439DRAFT_1619721 [Ramaria rubella]
MSEIMHFTPIFHTKNFGQKVNISVPFLLQAVQQGAKPGAQQVMKPGVQQVMKPGAQQVVKPDVQWVLKPDVQWVPKPDVQWVAKPATASLCMTFHVMWAASRCHHIHHSDLKAQTGPIHTRGPQHILWALGLRISHPAAHCD